MSNVCSEAATESASSSRLKIDVILAPLQYKAAQNKLCVDEVKIYRIGAL